MTMDHEVFEEGCKNCSALRNEIDKKNSQMENNNAQQLAGFLTLKQKIIGTDKLIREYQASKVERDILTRKNEEFVHLIDQLHRDLSIRNQDYTKLSGTAELLRKANSEYELKVKQLTVESQQWKSKAEAGQNFTSQLVEKVKILTKYEEEAKQIAAISRECEKTESKLLVLKEQLRDAKETATKSKKEFTQLQKNYTQLVKHAKQWGNIAETQGKLNAIQKRFFLKLCNKEAQDTKDDIDPSNTDAYEIDEQSKLLEHLLDDGNGSESAITSMDTSLKDTQVLGDNLASLSKRSEKSTGDSFFSKEAEQSTNRAQRKSGQGNGKPSKIPSSNKMTPQSPTKRTRIRTVSQNSASNSSDADNLLRSGTENNQRFGPYTRSRSVKPGGEGPKLFHTPEHRSAVAQSTSSISVDDMPCRSLVSMDTLLMAETKPVQGHVPKMNLRGSLGSTESQLELPGPQKTFQDKRIFAKTSTTLAAESIVGVKPLGNLFEPDVSDKTPEQRSGEERKRNMDQHITEARPKFETSVDPSSLFGFDSDSSSSSDIDIIPVPSTRLSIANKDNDRNILKNSSSSILACLDTVDEPTTSLSKKPVVEGLQFSPASETDAWRASNVSRSIFALETNLGGDSPLQDPDTVKSLEEKVSEFPSPEIAIPFTLSQEQDLRSVIPKIGDIQVSNNYRGIDTVANTDEEGKVGNKTPTVESNLDTGLLVAKEKNLRESPANRTGISSEKLDEPSSVLVKDFTENYTKSSTRVVAEHVASGIENLGITNVPTSVFALDMDLDISSSEPDSDEAKPSKETKSDLLDKEAVLQAPLPFSDQEPSTVVRGGIQDPTSHSSGDVVLTVETNQELPSEVSAVEIDCESELVDVNEENLGKSPRVIMDTSCEKREEKLIELVDKSKEIKDRSVTNQQLQELALGTGESNSHDIRTSMFMSDMDIDIISSQPNSDIAKLIEEEKSELSCKEVVLQPSPLSLDKQPITIVEGTLNCKDFSETDRMNQELHSEIIEVETNRESEPPVFSEENLVQHPRSETYVPSEMHEETNPPQAGESIIGEENTVNQKSLQISSSATEDPDTSITTISVSAVDLDVNLSDVDSDVTKHTEEMESKLLKAEDAVQVPIDLKEDPVTATQDSVNVQGSDSHYGCDPVLQELRNDVQPVGIYPECEMLVVNDANLGVSPSVKMDSFPEKNEDINPYLMNESTKSADKSTTKRSPRDLLPKTGEPDMDMAKSTEETKSQLSDTEVALRSSSDPAASSFIPRVLMVQESDAVQICTAVSSVKENKGLHDEVLVDRTNRGSRIPSECIEDVSRKSASKMDIVSKKHEEENSDQIHELRKTVKDIVTVASLTCPELETDKSDSTNMHSSIFALDVDLDISSSESESDTTNDQVKEKSEIVSKEVIHQGPSVEQMPVTNITESLDEQPSFTEVDIASQMHEEQMHQLVCTSKKDAEKSVTVVWQQHPASGSRESDINSVHCSITASNADLDISSSEPDSDELKTIEERKSELPNLEVNMQMPFSFDEEPSLVPEKVIVQSSESRGVCGDPSNVGEDRERRDELAIVEMNSRIGEMREELTASAINPPKQAPRDGGSLNKRATEEQSGNEAQTTSDVVDQKLTVFPAIPASQSTDAASLQNASSRVIPRQFISSNHLVLSEESPEVNTSVQQDAARLTVARSPCRFPVADSSNVSLAKKESQLPLVGRLDSIPESPVSPRVSSNLTESATFPQSTQISQPVKTSAFKVPRIPDAPPKVPDFISADFTQNYPWSRGSTQGVRRTAADDEVAVILKQIRTNIIEIPATLSPLPRSPDPQPLVSVKIEEPKSRFPILPRCAFNWTGKKLPLTDKLTERFGAYLHPGVQARVRFRRVSRRLRDIRSPDILSNCLKGVTNFAEAERRPKSITESVQLVEDVAGLVGWKDNAIEPTQKPDVSVQYADGLPETKSSEKDDEVTLSATKSLSKRKRKVKTPVRPKEPALFGSSSSESECESAMVPQSIQERVAKRSTERSLSEMKHGAATSKESMQTTSLVNASKAQVMAQLVEPIIPLGRLNRPDSTPFKPNEIRRETDSMFKPGRGGLGLGKGAKASQHTIAPCSDALLSAAIKAQTLNRVVASPKHIFKEPQVSREPVIVNPIVSENLPVQNQSPSRKRISHVLKKGLDSDSDVSAVPPASKRGRNQCEAPPTVSSQTAQPNEIVETLVEKASVNVRTRSKSRSALPIKPQEMVRLDERNQSLPGSEKSQLGSVQSRKFSCTKETVIEDTTSGSDTEPDTAVLTIVNSGGSIQPCSRREKSVTVPSETESNILEEGARIRHQLLERAEWSISDESSCSPNVVEESPQFPDEEVYPRSPDVKETPQSPDLEESPRSPDTEVSPKTADAEGTSIDQELEALDKDIKLTSDVLEIPLACSAETEAHQLTAFDFVFKELLQKSPPINQAVGKLKKDINLHVNQVFKNPDVSEKSWNGLIERAMRLDSKNKPFILIRKLVASVVQGWDNPIDLSKTPPAPPMAPVHQRCVMILKELDEANSKLTVEPSDNLYMFSDLFLSESSAVMFQQNSSLTLEEMCSLARGYTAVCRSRASLARARTFLFDCFYFMPPRSYALTFAVVSVWADVLRHISFPLGPSCIDQTIAYLLLHNYKIKAVPGIAGKVLQVRSFLQSTYGYKNVTTRTIDDLVNYLMTRFKETNSADEASSLSWCLALLSRWEGIDFAIEVIEKQLWPFLQRWSSGEGTNSGAAAVIVSIGMLGKTVPSGKRAGVKRVLSAMKVLLQSDDVIPSIQEAAIEAVVLLGEDEDPKSVIEVVKAWKLVGTNLSQHSRLVLKAFLQRHSSLLLPGL